jgi:hypothetical protein
MKKLLPLDHILAEKIHLFSHDSLFPPVMKNNIVDLARVIFLLSNPVSLDWAFFPHHLQWVLVTAFHTICLYNPTDSLPLTLKHADIMFLQNFGIHVQNCMV